MHTCPSCGAETSDEAACPHCEPGEGPTTCRRCGTEFQEGDACPACGSLAAPAVCEEHPDTDASGRCVLCGRAVCEACRAGDRRVVRCSDHREVPVIEGWAQVYTTGSEFEARLVSENLRAEGIDSQIFSQRDNMFSVELGDLSLVRLLVPAWHYEPARAVIRQHMDSEGEVAFACPACGEAYEPGAADCTGCGAPLA